VSPVVDFGCGGRMRSAIASGAGLGGGLFPVRGTVPIGFVTDGTSCRFMRLL